MDYLVSPICDGLDAKAQAVIDEMRAIGGFAETFIPALCAGREPGALRVERGDWNAASQLAIRPTPLANVEAMTISPGLSARAR